MEATLKYPERNLWAAASDSLVWLSGPVSERGAARGFRIAINLGGRMVHERRLAMREHPVGRRLLEKRPWLGYLREAWARGTAARSHLPFESVPWEELLTQPLRVARTTLGLPPLTDPAMNSAQWTDDSFFTRKFLASNVDYESIRGVKDAIEAGVQVKDLMRADADVRRRVEQLARDGAGLNVLVGALSVEA